MADEQKPDGSAPKDSAELQQVKSEFSRKTDNILKLVQEQNQKMEAIVQNIMAGQLKQQSANITAAEEDLTDLAVTNPAEFARKIKDSAKQEIRAEQSQMANRQNQENRILNEMLSDYPELNDRNSDLYLDAVKVYEQFTSEEKSNPISMRTAIRDAAANLGVVPAKKRGGGSSDSFSVSGDNDPSLRSSQRQGSKKISDATYTFAQLLGRPVDDPKYMESLQKTAERKNWSRYK